MRNVASERAACAGVIALHHPVDDARALTVVIHGEAFVDGHAVFGRQRLPAAFDAEPLHFAPAAAREHALQRVFAAVRDDPADAGDRPHEVVELRFDSGEIGEDVGVIEFEVVQDRGARPVVDELRALVEERRVVFVGLDHEEARIGEPRRYAEVQRHPADQEAGIHAGVFEQPRQHRRRGGLAVRAGHREHPFAVQHMFPEPLRTGRVRQAAVEDRFHQRIAARHHVADHEQIGLQIDLLRPVPLDKVDAERFELRAHRRIDAGVATGHLVAGAAREHGETAHERAADAERTHCAVPGKSVTHSLV